ncbi:hypothetical protein [uncultured Methanocorpusculum sp.]|nr:hypothetical protein [uncultured Methanocorpusculum sp.]
MNELIDVPNLENITITGNTTGTSQIQYYLFGINYFETGFANINSDGSYRMDINKLSHDAGQYTLVLQHPGEDAVFNVYPEYVPESGSYDIKIMDEVNDEPSNTILYNTGVRTGRNAADVLCMGIDTQNIDDQYLRIPLVVDPTEGSFISITTSYWSHSFLYGDTLTLSGVNTNSSYVHLFFEYPNGTRQLLSNLPISVSTDKVWTTSFAFPETHDLGTYTIFAVAGDTPPRIQP